jgi:hypothetical protein
MIRKSTRKTEKSTENYPVMDVLAVAVAVDRAQGFVRCGKKNDDEGVVQDNRQAALTTLRSMNGSGDYSADKVFVPTVDDRTMALTILNHFSEILTMDSLTGNLIKLRAGGHVDDFNQTLNDILIVGTADIGKDLAMIVSLPNSYRISHKRSTMADFWHANKENGYISAVKQRMEVTGNVMDAKTIPRHNITLVTVFTDDKKIAKFFLNDESQLPSRAGPVTFTGTVKKHDVNPHTGCQETMFNRVKVT